MGQSNPGGTLDRNSRSSPESRWRSRRDREPCPQRRSRPDTSERSRRVNPFQDREGIPTRDPTGIRVRLCSLTCASLRPANRPEAHSKQRLQERKSSRRTAGRTHSRSDRRRLRSRRTACTDSPPSGTLRRDRACRVRSPHRRQTAAAADSPACTRNDIPRGLETSDTLRDSGKAPYPGAGAFGHRLRNRLSGSGRRASASPIRGQGTRRRPSPPSGAPGWPTKALHGPPTPPDVRCLQPPCRR